MTIGKISPSLHSGRGSGIGLVVGFLLLWIAGTRLLRCLLFAHRPRIVQTTWNPMVLFVALAFAIGLGAAALPDSTPLERILFGLAAFTLFVAIGLLSLYAGWSPNEALLPTGSFRYSRWTRSTATRPRHWLPSHMEHEPRHDGGPAQNVNPAQFCSVSRRRSASF